MDFFAFVASTDGTDAISAKVTPAGPYLIKGATLPDEVPPYVNDLNGYINSGNAYPALEFLSPIKGPNLEQICVAVGTGQMTAEEAAANYDEDVKKQAQQLGIPGWDNKFHPEVVYFPLFLRVGGCSYSLALRNYNIRGN